MSLLILIDFLFQFSQFFNYFIFILKKIVQKMILTIFTILKMNCVRTRVFLDLNVNYLN